MSPLAKLVSLWAASTVGALAVISAGAFAVGIRINSTGSIPKGIYIKTGEPLAVGAYVIVCPPDLQVFKEAKARGYIGPGFCPGGYGNLMKRVLAAKNDQVTVSTQGLTVNGQLLAHSVALKADGAGRPMPAYQANAYTLGNLEVLLMSDASPTSFDGRYFGPLNVSQVRSVIRPVFTW